MSIRDILDLRNFRYLWLGQIVSNFGDALTHLTLILLINRITGGFTAAIAFLHASVGAFFSPARSAIIPNIVPREGMLSVNSLSQISLVLFRVLGTATAGMIIGLFQPFWPVFIIDAAPDFGSPGSYGPGYQH